MAEEYTLTTPINKGTIASYQVQEVFLFYKPPSASYYRVLFLSKTTPDTVEYLVNDGPANAYGPGTVANLATSRLKQMNVMNFTTTSMHKRFLQFAQTDINPKTGQPFLPAGSVTGVPDP